jgi:hypothetical protein
MTVVMIQWCDDVCESLSYGAMACASVCVTVPCCDCTTRVRAGERVQICQIVQTVPWESARLRHFIHSPLGIQTALTILDEFTGMEEALLREFGKGEIIQ